MDAEQTARLHAIIDRVTAEALQDCDPENWDGAGLRPVQMTQLEKQNRLNDKKNAVQTVALLTRLIQLRATETPAGNTTPDQQFDSLAAARAAQEKADQIIAKMMGK